MTTPTAHLRIDVNDLQFDAKNPRLTEFDLSQHSTDVEFITLLWEVMDVQELVLSMDASGFFEHEPLIICEEEGKNIVIEGNRRLAAVKLLVDPDLATQVKVEVPILPQRQRQALRLVPCIRETRETAWRFLGFKHVNGPAKWSSYAKSHYIADVHRQYNIPLDNIARQIGDTHKTVQRLYRALMVIEQAERTGVFRRDNRFHRHFSFSHLYTGLGYEGLSTYVGLSPETEEQQAPVPSQYIEELGLLCLWLYGSKRDETPPVIKSQNPDLRYLNAVLQDGEATSALRDGVDLSIAYEISQPSSTVFADSLRAAKRDLEKARGLVSTGFDGSEQLLRTADEVAELAVDLFDEMERKTKPRRDRRTSDSD